jgi:hypothetical protein
VYHVSLPLVKDDNATKPIPRPTAFWSRTKRCYVQHTILMGWPITCTYS